MLAASAYNQQDEDAAIGVVIPAREAAATLPWTALSLRAQCGTSPRVVVVDSYSTDGTLEICERWNLPVLSVPPGNMYRALNCGMATFDTPWLTYLNSDDLVYADGYRRLIHRGEEGGFDVVYGDVDFIDGAGRYLYSKATFRPGLATRLLVAGVMPFAQPAAIFRREVFNRLHGFDERFHYIADLDFYARGASAGFRFGKASGPPVAAFRLHDGQLSLIARKALDLEKAERRNEGGHALRATRIGLGLLWQLRNIANYWAGFRRRRAATMHRFHRVACRIEPRHNADNRPGDSQASKRR